jgi:hypothetical protein
MYSDGEKIVVGEHSGRVDVSIMKAGYHGTGARCFHAFLEAAGFDVTFDQIVNMKNGTVLRRRGLTAQQSPPRPSEKRPAGRNAASDLTAQQPPPRPLKKRPAGRNAAIGAGFLVLCIVTAIITEGITPTTKLGAILPGLIIGLTGWAAIIMFIIAIVQAIRNRRAK